MKKKFKAAIIGLGNIGFQLSLDCLRKGIWSHAAAYDTCTRTDLCAAVEIDREKARRFTTYCKGHTPVFSTIKDFCLSISKRSGFPESGNAKPHNQNSNSSLNTKLNFSSGRNDSFLLNVTEEP